MALAHHLASHGEQRKGPEPVPVGAQQRCDHDVAAGGDDVWLATSEPLRLRRYSGGTWEEVGLPEGLDPILDWTAETVEAAVRDFAERRELGPKQLFMPVRIAVTGRTATPGLFDTMAVLGKEICRRRLRCAMDVLRTMKA